MVLAGVLPIDHLKDTKKSMNLVFFYELNIYIQMVTRIPQFVFELVYNIEIPKTCERIDDDYCSSEELLTAFSSFLINKYKILYSYERICNIMWSCKFK